jgi:hypothetical protein
MKMGSLFLGETVEEALGGFEFASEFVESQNFVTLQIQMQIQPIRSGLL